MRSIISSRSNGNGVVKMSIDHSKQYILAAELLMENRRLHEEYKKEYHYLFRLMDILFITFIVLNIGALCLTNMLVIKNEPGKVLKEANPVTSDVYNFQPHPESKIVFTQFIFHLACYAILFAIYLSNRHNVKSHQQLIICFIMIFFMFFAGLTDFSNDLGYALGKWLWGV